MDLNNVANNNDNFWEVSFVNHKEMWGEMPAESIYNSLEIFNQYNVKKILVPGFGYGRNAKVFIDNGFDVTGIEISKTAIEISKKFLNQEIIVYNGSVNEMPFDNQKYDAIYSYSLLHLLNNEYRNKFIQSCYNQLNENGLLILLTLSKNDFRYGDGILTEKDTFLTKNGVSLFFYDESELKKDFERFKMISLFELTEPVSNRNSDLKQTFWQIICQK